MKTFKPKGKGVGAVVAPLIAAAAPDLLQKFMDFVKPVPRVTGCPPPPGYFNPKCTADKTGLTGPAANRWFYREGIDPEEFKDIKTDLSMDKMEKYREQYLQRKEQGAYDDFEGEGMKKKKKRGGCGTGGCGKCGKKSTKPSTRRKTVKRIKKK